MKEQDIGVLVVLVIMLVLLVSMLVLAIINPSEDLEDRARRHDEANFQKCQFEDNFRDCMAREGQRSWRSGYK